MRDQACDTVQQAIAKLAPAQRVVVVLRYTEGLAYDDIAAILGCSSGTVASRLSRAHKALEQRLGHLRAMQGRVKQGGGHE